MVLSMSLTHATLKTSQFLLRLSVSKIYFRDIAISVQYICVIVPGKVILDPDLTGVPLLILANKQDRFVRNNSILVVCVCVFKLNCVYNFQVTNHTVITTSHL